MRASLSKGAGCAAGTCAEFAANADTGRTHESTRQFRDLVALRSQNRRKTSADGTATPLAETLDKPFGALELPLAIRA
jgi:hypothetical protein